MNALKLPDMPAKTNKRPTRIGQNLRFLREHAKLTQDELAEKLDIERVTITNIETGKTKEPESSTVKKFAVFFGVSRDEMEEGDFTDEALRRRLDRATSDSLVSVHPRIADYIRRRGNELLDEEKDFLSSLDFSFERGVEPDDQWIEGELRNWRSLHHRVAVGAGARREGGPSNP